MSADASVTREAWWGGSRATGGKPDVVHIVDWPTGRDHGPALCGKRIGARPAGGSTGIRTYPLGTAAQLRVAVCKPCQDRLAARRPSASVVPVQARRNRRVHA